MLKGKAKRKYQREYMREKRGLTPKAKSNTIVRPKTPVQMDSKTFGYGTKNIPTPAWMKTDGN